MASDPKIYEFNDISDVIIYLNLMIELTLKHYFRYKHYFGELEKLYLDRLHHITKIKVKDIEGKSLEELLQKTNIRDNYMKNRENYKLKFYDFKALEDKLNTPKLLLENLIGDRTKNAVSYLGFRDRIKKFNKECSNNKIELEELNQGKMNILNELNSARNYEHHITDAKFIEWKNYRETQLQQLKQNGTLFEWPSNILYIDKYKFVEIEWLFQLYFSNKNFKEDIEIILRQMRRDYSKLVRKDIDIKEIEHEKLSNAYFDISINGIKRHVGKLK